MIRRADQNRTLWYIYGVIAAQARERPEDIHEYFKVRLRPAWIALPNRDGMLGNAFAIGKSTKRLTEQEFDEYCTAILRIARDEMGLEIVLDDTVVH